MEKSLLSCMVWPFGFHSSLFVLKDIFIHIPKYIVVYMHYNTCKKLLSFMFGTTMCAPSLPLCIRAWCGALSLCHFANNANMTRTHQTCQLQSQQLSLIVSPNSHIRPYIRRWKSEEEAFTSFIVCRWCSLSLFDRVGVFFTRHL